MPSAQAVRSDVAFDDGEIPAVDGRPLAATIFRPPRAVDRDAIVTIHPATAVHRRLYAAFAAFLAAHGFLVVTFDWRGTGDSRLGPLVDDPATMRDWGALDLEGVFRHVAEHHPNRRHLAVTHSVGGQLLGLAPSCGRLEAVYALASQLGSWRLWPAPRRWLYKAAFHTLWPWATAARGYFPGRAFGMGDLPAGVGLEWARWCRSRAYLVDEAGEPMRPHNHRLTARAHWVAFADDTALAPEAAVAALARIYPKASSTLETIDPKALRLPPIGHFGYFRRRFRDTLWPRAVAWLTADMENPQSTP
ncbi:MAG: alpha/beta hydrolase [Acidobacteriota bacterium]